MKIAICGLVKSSNLGDPFICKSLTWIIEDVVRDKGVRESIDFVLVDLAASNDDTVECKGFFRNRIKNLYAYKWYGIPVELFHYALKKVFQKIKTPKRKNQIHKIRHFIWKHSVNLGKRHRKYFSEKFENIDLVVICGGGLLEYSYNAYQEPIAMATGVAENLGIPVACNAIGRAGEFDKNDFRCQVLMNAFNKDCVKYVSARDSREDVQECVGERFYVKHLADAAFCVSEATGISADPIDKFVGIGIIRGNAFLSYAEGFDEEMCLNLFADIARNLESKGYKYEFFTNGLEMDYKFGLKIIERLGADENLLVKRPTKSEELLKTISRYSCIITCRMHSSIAAFSMGIPSIILSWNKKVDKYMNFVGYPERAISQENLNAEYIVDKMEQATLNGVSEENLCRIKRLARESVEDYMYLISDNE